MGETAYRRETPCGTIAGTTCQWPGIEAYKGIRYANAGRWEYPSLASHWEGTYEAVSYGACSYQPRAFYDEEQMPEKAFYYNEFRRGESYQYSEDCLFLNVWTPETATAGDRLPVLFYIHGGGFTGGCGHERHFDGPVWPTKGCVAVTINYRLGPLGFACLPSLQEEAGHTGNYGLFDQLAALQWVRDNIAAFGGDPDNITVMGQSAGAMSVQQLCLSPLTKGMISKAVMSSGAGVSQFFDARPAETTYDFWESVQQKAGCESLAAFRALSAEQLFQAWDEAKKEAQNGGLSCAPVIDHVLLDKAGSVIAAEGGQLHIPYMLGLTSEDIVPPILYSMLQDWCRTQADQNGPACYAWFFERRLPGDDCGAWHSSDLWYWFGTLDHCWRPMTDRDRALSAEMVDYLSNFAHTGSPQGDGLPEWRPTDHANEAVLCLADDTTAMGAVDIKRLEWTMQNVKAVGE